MDTIHFLINKRRKAQSIIAYIARSAFPLLRVKRQLFDKLRHDLLCHEKMEEVVWHPELSKDAKLFESIKTLITQENNPEKAIKELKKIPIPQEWKQDFNKFKRENISSMREMA